MIILKDFKEYEPVSDKEKAIHKKIGALFYFSADGVEWYGAISSFAADTWKVKYHSDGIIVEAEKDASFICPADGSIAEVAALPEGFERGKWRFEEATGDIVRDAGVMLRDAQLELNHRLTEAESVILLLSRAVKYDTASDDDKARLEKWERYSVDLSRTDISTAPNTGGVNWPEKPQ
jgi:hypothetical protein